MKHALVSIVFAVIAFLSIAVPTTLAQHNEVARQARSLAEQVKDSFLDSLPDEEADPLRQIHFRFVADPTFHNAIASISPDGRRHIDIGMGLIIGLQLYCDALVVESTFSRNRVAEEYIVSTHERLSIEGGTARPIEKFARLTPQQAQIWRTDPELARRSRHMQLAALSHIVAHEYGHHANDAIHTGQLRPSPAKQRRYERRADEWAVRKQIEMGRSPAIGAVISNLFLYENELLQFTPDLKRSHPPSLERAMEAVEESIRETDTLLEHENLRGNTRQQLIDAHNSIKEILQSRIDQEAQVTPHSLDRSIRSDETHPVLKRRAAYRLANMYANGAGGTELSYERAYQYFVLAAVMGDPRAQLTLAKMNESGIGTPDGRPNLDQARFMYEQAAQQRLLGARAALSGFRQRHPVTQ